MKVCAALILLAIVVCTCPVVLHAADGAILRVETGMHTAPIHRLAMDVRGRFFVTGSEDKTVRVWEMPTGKLLKILRPPVRSGGYGAIHALAISPDGRHIACAGNTSSGGPGYTVFIFDRTTGKMARGITGLPASIASLSYSYDGETLAVGMSGQGGIRLYRARDNSLAAEDRGYGGEAVDMAFDRNGRLHTVSADGHLRLYDAKLSLMSKMKTVGSMTPSAMAIVPDGSRVAVGYRETRDVDVFSGVDLSPLFSQQVPTNGTKSVAWSADGRVLYAANSTPRSAQLANVITRWPDGGKGRYQVLRTNNVWETTNGMVSTAGGGLVFATAEPSLGMFNADNRLVLNERSSINHFWGDPEGLCVTSDGTAVRFNFRKVEAAHYERVGIRAWMKTQPVIFSIAERQLVRYDERAEMRGRSADSDPMQAAPPISHSTAFEMSEWRNSPDVKVNGVPLKLGKNETVHSRAFTPDNRYVLVGTSTHLRLFDPQGREKWNTKVSAAWSVNVARNGKVAVAAHDDGTIRWYRADTGAELIAFFPHADTKRWVLWTPKGYYDASPGAEELIGWHVNRGADDAADFFSVSRFRSVYYRPDVVAKTLETKDADSALAEADKESGRKTEEVSITKLLPPLVTILYPADGERLRDSEITLKFHVRSPSGDPVTAVKVLIDGRPAKTAEVVPASGELRQVRITVPQKDSEITVLASNKNATSEPSTVRTKWAGSTRPIPPPPPAISPHKAQAETMAVPKAASMAKKPPEAKPVVPREERPVQAPPGIAKPGQPGAIKPPAAAAKPPERPAEKTRPEPLPPPPPGTGEFIIKPKLYILAVGISNYKDKDLQLGFAAKDAKDFAGVMTEQKGFLYRDVVIKLLTDEGATKDEILDGFDWIIRETTSKDVAIIFFAGHGINDPNGIYHFLPFNIDFDRMKRTAVPFSDVKNTVASLAGKAILFVDTCHSGNVMGTRRAPPSDINVFVNELSSAENGAVVFSSSTGRQYSMENDAWGNGAFTLAIVEGLRGKADLMGKGRITINMLDLYLSERVKELTKGRQTPTTAKPTTIPDFPVAVIVGKK